ncbi:Gfo/Idh/MocA family oxidoreductase [Streptomyces sp. DSM 44915]|uniref:Gfo/Idh/MocA family oxidoreductase n=1 Tax=Streptomyces chisholmiae TaxID=3075540 RepID=A0ABU2JIS2_9ACTN|nr:Gfo/Idh/MocA family oxidoreductase [Streptomyces sp. DSM 44915]MDT0264882.1 Gfo/Idh/MocA family oxidoreductase [Streptomyces sp. DSM 44915]
MRIGLLGTGPWAHITQGPALVEHPGVELVGVWGRRPEAAAELAVALGTHPYDSPEALFAECEAVAFALPPDVQAPLAVRAAAAGCHLLLDKPVATTVAGARQVADAVAAHDRASVVFCTLRFAPETEAWVAAQSGTDGWLTGRADWFSPVFGGADTPYSQSVWRQERGALWDVGPHALSLLLPPLGDVADLAAIRAIRGPGDLVHASLRHTTGATSTLTLSHTVPPQAANVTAELRGAAGVSTLPERADGGAVRPFQRAVDALVEAAGGGPAHPCDAHFGLRVTEILAAIEAALDA